MSDEFRPWYPPIVLFGYNYIDQPWDEKYDGSNYPESVVSEHTGPLPWDSPVVPAQASAGVPIAGVPAGVPAQGVPATQGDPLRDADSRAGRPAKYADLAEQFLPHDPKGYRKAKEKRDRLANQGRKPMIDTEESLVLPPNSIASYPMPGPVDPVNLRQLFKAWYEHNAHMHLGVNQFRTWLQAKMLADDNHKQTYLQALASHKEANPEWVIGQQDWRDVHIAQINEGE